MVNAGCLKFVAHVAEDHGVIADEHGREQGRVGTIPHTVLPASAHVGQDAAPDATAPESQPLPGFPGQNLDVICAHGGHGGYSQAMQIAFVVERAGVVKISRQAQSRREANAVTVSQVGKFGDLFVRVVIVRLLGKDGSANSYRPGELKVAEANDFGLKVEAFTGSPTCEQCAVAGYVA